MGVEGSGGNVLDEVIQYVAKCSVLVVFVYEEKRS